jgi:crotonobetainyl-CoA:carnitine CoA-transferase CaiB-like acyl-CoA transferase
MRLRDGNRHAHMAPHGAFPCANENGVHDRWVTIACRTDGDWAVLASIIGADASRFATLADRKLHEDELEKIVAAWTRTRTRAEVAQLLQTNGIAAVPVEDFADLHDDPQLALRKHFEPHTHAFLGPGLYERNGFRLPDSPAGYDQAGPTLGQDTDWVLRDLLGCSDAEVEQLKSTGAVE